MDAQVLLAQKCHLISKKTQADVRGAFLAQKLSRCCKPISKIADDTVVLF